MTGIKILWLLLGFFLLPSLPARAQNLTVLAAASLKESLDEVVTQFQRSGGAKLVVAYAASSALAKQIENGALADVFISASSKSQAPNIVVGGRSLPVENGKGKYKVMSQFIK